MDIKKEINELAEFHSVKFGGVTEKMVPLSELDTILSEVFETVRAIPVYGINTVSEITLLSNEEWKKAKILSSVPKLTGYWWTRSPGFSGYACNVDYIGSVYDGCSTCNSSYGVRPAFRIPKLKSKIGSKILVVNTICTVIGKGYALSDTVVCQHRFDAKSNDYAKSEIKQFINSIEFLEVI